MRETKEEEGDCDCEWELGVVGVVRRQEAGVESQGWGRF